MAIGRWLWTSAVAAVLSAQKWRRAMTKEGALKMAVHSQDPESVSESDADGGSGSGSAAAPDSPFPAAEPRMGAEEEARICCYSDKRSDKTAVVVSVAVGLADGLCLSLICDRDWDSDSGSGMSAGVAFRPDAGTDAAVAMAVVDVVAAGSAGTKRVRRLLQNGLQ